MTATEIKANAKPTPGPWVKIGPNGTGHDTKWYIEHRSPGCSGGAFAIVEVLHKTAEAFAIGEKNATLIAAAPDLLAACKECLLIVDEAYEATGYIKVAKSSEQRMRIEAAIRKATA